MTEKIIAKIKRYPFQTGIVVGIIACLILSLFFSLFQDHGSTLSGNSDIIREDYLRMTINEYSENRDDQLAEWRFSHLGGESGETLRLMSADSSIAPNDVASFAKAVGKEEVFKTVNNSEKSSEDAAGTPTNPKKGVSGFGKVILILFCAAAIGAVALYVSSMIKTKKKQKRRENVSQLFHEDASINMVPANEPSIENDTDKAQNGDSVPAFDLDNLFAVPGKNTSESGVSVNREPVEPFVPEEPEEIEEPAEDEPEAYDEPEYVQKPVMAEPETEEEEPVTEYEEETIEEAPETVETEESAPESVVIGLKDAEPEASGRGLQFTDSRHDIRKMDEEKSEPEETEPSEPEKKDIPNPLIEDESAPESDDPLLSMIRKANTGSAALNEQAAEEEVHPSEPNVDFVAEPEEEVEEEEAPNDVIIHYQSTYRIGNDMFDEIFSIDQGDNFRGECGIGIGETLNNTEPKAVTAFEIWLFDRDDIHTSTNYLLSDFAMQNEKIADRLRQHGNCQQLRKNAVYTLETQTLRMDLQILELEYGSEMQEKNSYFTTVTFDIAVHGKPAA